MRVQGWCLKSWLWVGQGTWEPEHRSPICQGVTESQSSPHPAPLSKWCTWGAATPRRTGHKLAQELGQDKKNQSIQLDLQLVQTRCPSHQPSGG
jgi:hypothetical protein